MVNVNKPKAFFDIECYPNWACINIKYDGEHYMYQHYDGLFASPEILQDWLNRFTLVGFNNKGYDDIIYQLIMKGTDNYRLYEVSKAIIGGARPWQLCSDHGLEIDLDTVDIMPVLPGQAGLKLYGARVHSHKLQELPINPHSNINQGQAQTLMEYCKNDVNVTEELFNHIIKQVQLRETMSVEFDVDLRSKSDAQIAESVIGHEYYKQTGFTIQKPNVSNDAVYKYNPPPWVKLRYPVFQQVFNEIVNADFRLTETGHIETPECLKSRIVFFDDKSYQIGIGGLHSIDGVGYYTSDDDHIVCDVDVTSYYPNCLLNAGWYPSHIGPEFLQIYRNIVETRLKAKAEEDMVTANALKITINGTFGKTSSKYSSLYAPEMMFHITITGQLTLLMLIEDLFDHGYSCISANTDGVVYRFPKKDMPKIRTIVSEWEKRTGFDMEYTFYKKYVRRDVNNYFAICIDKKEKERLMV